MSSLKHNFRSSEQVNGVKFCFYRLDKCCFHVSCDFLDALGNVRLCNLHPNPKGRFAPRIVKEVKR